MTNQFAAEITAAKKSLDEKTRGLSPELLRLRLGAIANGGFDPSRPVDPLERSWARQALDTITARDDLERIATAHDALSTSRNPRKSEAERLFGLKRLEEEHDGAKIRLLQAAEADHSVAAREARTVAAKRKASAAQAVAIRSAAEARAEAILADHPAIDTLAAAIVARKRAL